jgi:hypothetical protein
MKMNKLEASWRVSSDPVLRLLVATLLSGVTLSGCAAELINVSSGAIGCPREEISVRDGRSGFSSRSWVAECRGRTYYCSGSAGTVDCHPDNSSSQAPSANSENALPAPPEEAAGMTTPPPPVEASRKKPRAAVATQVR